ncbi:LRR RECEPTOR-LIKE SERINE/THREONINE-PROTEIN KINASE-RELATED [Salix purpurea]|uniref:LRR RECEPTOR-LIKE SERINE/THREONINE-PROTEIN KINASE-RELATED n=1 Tax=Salix purpurea TaxID=77065 RepID=A0A9Q0WHA0_SALPP|nr:LRR RECEPTOR-LIKE SERINE/THREONINE-PROTEIN KINASE-RELATED [Salix purpurea]
MAAILFRIFLAVFWVDFAQATDSLLSPKGVNYEVAALMAVKKEMRDETGAMNGWDLNSVDPCTWKMVGCSPEGFVISLEMASARLSGTLSPSIGNLSHLRTMLLQSNHLSGPIPEEIGKLSDLQTLDLSGNQFVGGIPSSLGFLTHLSYLRLSKNKLTGQIPRLVANLTGLSFLDLSFNNLSGPTPKILAKGYRINGNSYLCTSSLAQKCTGISNPVNETLSSEQASSHHRWVLSLAIGISCTFVISVMLLACWCSKIMNLILGHLKRFSFRELQVATNNFSPKNILGQGGYGVVYKGCLPNKTFIAVKRLKDPNFTGELQFQTEVEMIGLALHRNLLCLYGFCMTSDERLLVYPYMPNGSVADRLRETWQKALDAGNGQVQKGMILDWVRTLHEEKRLEVLVDRDLKGCFDESELEKAVDLALQCTQSHPNLRPKMSAVLKVLEGLAGQPAIEEPQGVSSIGEARACNCPGLCSDAREESSFIIEAMELSGPR